MERKTIRLGEILERQERSFAPKKEVAYQLIGVRWYGAGCHVHDTVHGHALKTSVLFRVHEGDIIYNKMWASKGSFSVVPQELDGTAATNEYPTFRAKNGSSPKYIKHLLSQTWFWKRAKAWSNGTTGRARLDPDDFKRMPIPNIPLERQNAIAVILDSLDSTIHKTEQMVVKLQTQRDSVMSTILRAGESGTTKRVEELARFTGGRGFGPEDWKTSGLPIIRIQNLNGNNDFDYYQGPTEEKWLIPTGTLLFAWAGTRGVSFGPKVWKGPKGVLNQHIYRVTPFPGVNQDYLFWLLWLVTKDIEKKAHGFKATLLHVQKHHITGAAVPFPSSKEQRKIVELGQAFESRLVAEQVYLDQLHKLKHGLAQALLSGIVHIPPHLLTILSEDASDVR